MLMIVYENFHLGGHSESAGMQEDVKNRPCGAKDLEILLSLGSSQPLVEPTGAQESARSAQSPILNDVRKRRDFRVFPMALMA